MSGADLFEDGFPHGTREGYDRGCRGAACPAGIEHGLTCRRAVELNAGDYRYARLVREGKTPAQIAAALVERPHAATPVAVPPPPRIAVPEDVPPTVEDDDAEDEDTTTTDLEEVTEPKEPTMPTPADIAPDKKRIPPTPAPASGRTKDELTEIRQWAKDNGHDVAAHGRIPTRLIELFDAREPSAPTVAAVEQVDSAAPDPEPEAPAIDVPGPASRRTLAEWLAIRGQLAAVVTGSSFQVSQAEALKVAETLLLDGWFKADAA